MKVLIGCECTATVRDAFLKRGHDAWSCDLKQTEGDKTYHLQMDVLKALQLEKWDFVGLHPECTALTVSGNRHYAKGTAGWSKRISSVEWTVQLWELAKQTGARVYLENPVGVLATMGGMKNYQAIQPWQFGHGETKKTCLWLHKLPPLVPTKMVAGREARIWKMPPSEQRQAERSRTYQGIADAMANQWG